MVVLCFCLYLKWMGIRWFVCSVFRSSFWNVFVRSSCFPFNVFVCVLFKFLKCVCPPFLFCVQSFCLCRSSFCLCSVQVFEMCLSTVLVLCSKFLSVPFKFLSVFCSSFWNVFVQGSCFVFKVFVCVVQVFEMCLSRIFVCVQSFCPCLFFAFVPCQKKNRVSNVHSSPSGWCLSSFRKINMVKIVIVESPNRQYQYWGGKSGESSGEIFEEEEEVGAFHRNYDTKLCAYRKRVKDLGQKKQKEEMDIILY